LYVTSTAGTAPRNSPHTDSDTDKPAQTFILCELIPTHDKRTNQLSSVPDNVWYWNMDCKVNLTFTDGHAKVYTRGQAFQSNPGVPGWADWN